MFRHVNDPNFGIDTTAFDAELERLKKDTLESGFTPDYIDNDLVMRGLYETAFGIRNHYGPEQHPFAMVAANPKEDYWPYSSKYRDTVVFIEERVHEALGIDIDTFFKKPRHEIELLLAAVRQRNKKHSAAMAAATSTPPLHPGTHPKPPYK